MLFFRKASALRFASFNWYNICVRTEGPYFIIDQIGRSGTSIGANVTEAQHAISEKEFLQKMYIAYKECSETLYWLDLLHASRYIEVEMYYSLSEKCRELEKLLTMITKTTASHLNKKI